MIHHFTKMSVYAHKTTFSLTPLRFIEVLVPSQESRSSVILLLPLLYQARRVVIHVRGIKFVSIFRIRFRNFLTVHVVYFVCLFISYFLVTLIDDLLMTSWYLLVFLCIHHLYNISCTRHEI